MNSLRFNLKKRTDMSEHQVKYLPFLYSERSEIQDSVWGRTTLPVHVCMSAFHSVRTLKYYILDR